MKIPKRKRRIVDDELKSETASAQPSIVAHVIPQSPNITTDLRSSCSRSSSSESIDEAPDDEAVFNMYSVKVPFFTSNFDCNPTLQTNHKEDLIHIFQCTNERSYDEDERTFWSQFDATDKGKPIPPLCGPQHDDCDIQTLCVALFDYLFGGGDSIYNQANRSQSVGNVPTYPSTGHHGRPGVYNRKPIPDMTTMEFTAFEMTYSEVEERAQEDTVSRVEKRRKWPFDKQSKAQSTTNAINNNQSKSNALPKKVTIIETESTEQQPNSTEVPKVIFTSEKRAGQTSQMVLDGIISALALEPEKVAILGEKDCANEVPNKIFVTPEKREVLASNGSDVECIRNPTPILRSNSAKTKHLLMALKQTPEKSFHLTDADDVIDYKQASSSNVVTPDYESDQDHVSGVTSQVHQEQHQNNEMMVKQPESSTAAVEYDLSIQHDELERKNNSSIILVDLKEQQKKHSVKLEGDAVTLASHVSAWSSNQRQVYRSLLSHAVEKCDFPSVKERLESKVAKVLLMHAEKQAQLQTSGMADKSFVIEEESTMEDQYSNGLSNYLCHPIGSIGSISQSQTHILPDSMEELQGVGREKEMSPDRVNSRQQGVLLEQGETLEESKAEFNDHSNLDLETMKVPFHKRSTPNVNQQINKEVRQFSDIEKHEKTLLQGAVFKTKQPNLINSVLRTSSKSKYQHYPLSYIGAVKKDNWKKLSDNDEDSQEGSVTADSIVSNTSPTDNNDEPSIPASFKSSCQSIKDSREDDCTASLNEAADTSLKESVPKTKGITFPIIRIKPLIEHMEESSVLFTASLLETMKPSESERKIPQNVINNDDLALISSLQKSASSFDTDGDESTVETSNVTYFKKNTRIKFQRLKKVPPLSALFGRTTTIPFSELEDEDSSDADAFSPFLEEIDYIPTEKQLGSETNNSIHGDVPMGKEADNESNSNQLIEGYCEEKGKLSGSSCHATSLGKNIIYNSSAIVENPEAAVTENLNANQKALQVKRGHGYVNQSVSQKVMIEACDMSIISEISAASRSSSKNIYKKNIAINLEKNAPAESHLDTFLSVNKENEEPSSKGTQSVRTGCYSVATERAKIHNQFADETKGKGWVATMKIASSGEWKPYGGWIDLHEELYSKDVAEKSEVGRLLRPTPPQCKDSKKESSRQSTGELLVDGFKPTNSKGTSIVTLTHEPNSQFHEISQPLQLPPSSQPLHISAQNKYPEVSTKRIMPKITPGFDAKSTTFLGPSSQVQQTLPESNDHKLMENFTPQVTKISNLNVVKPILADKLHSRGKVASVGSTTFVDAEYANLSHTSKADVSPKSNKQFRGKLMTSAEEPARVDIKAASTIGTDNAAVGHQRSPLFHNLYLGSQLPPPPPPDVSLLKKGKQSVASHGVVRENSSLFEKYHDTDKNITYHEDINSSGRVFDTSLANVLSSTEVKIKYPSPEYVEKADDSTFIEDNENTEYSSQMDESSSGNRSVASNFFDLVRCGVRGELPSAHLEFLRRAKESRGKQQQVKSRFQNLTSAMLSCTSTKAYLNTIQEEDDNTKDVTGSEADGFRQQHHFQESNKNYARDEVSEVSECSRDTLSQFFKEEMKEPHRMARVRLERLAAQRVDSMINSSYSNIFEDDSPSFSHHYVRAESRSPTTAAFVQ